MNAYRSRVSNNRIYKITINNLQTAVTNVIINFLIAFSVYPLIYFSIFLCFPLFYLLFSDLGCSEAPLNERYYRNYCYELFNFPIYHGSRTWYSTLCLLKFQNINVGKTDWRQIAKNTRHQRF